MHINHEKEVNMNKEKRSNSFINRGRTFSDISFEAKTSTGIKGIQYLRNGNKYRVIWKGYFIACVKDFQKARDVLIRYLEETNQRDKYTEKTNQVKAHLATK